MVVMYSFVDDQAAQTTSNTEKNPQRDIFRLLYVEFYRETLQISDAKGVGYFFSPLPLFDSFNGQLDSSTGQRTPLFKSMSLKRLQSRQMVLMELPRSTALICISVTARLPRGRVGSVPSPT
jgi:hypothetical protein